MTTFEAVVDSLGRKANSSVKVMPGWALNAGYIILSKFA